ncbi:MAG: hypothetical protein HY906_00625 [Deltaproteobacteria bacterium]|nr:hypothetical protein [Deltaproteobacteria bacterium]
MPKTRSALARQRAQLSLVQGTDRVALRRTVTTLGDLVSAAFQVTGSTQGAARLLRESSPLGQLLDRRIVIGWRPGARK